MPLTDEQKAAREAWLAALESGEYTQTILMLADETGYCCLGVACELLGLSSGWDYELGCKTFGEERKRSTLPPEAISILGFVRYNPTLSSGRYAGRTLSVLNDDEGLSFKEIAAEIRLQPEDWDGNP
jgi:hypothetical protein